MCCISYIILLKIVFTPTFFPVGCIDGVQVYGTSRNHAHRWTEVMERSDNTCTLIDLCGHEKYLKTTLFGLTGLMPDYCMLVVGSNMGVQVMTREHISIACALNLPMFVAVTKVWYMCVSYFVLVFQFVRNTSRNLMLTFCLHHTCVNR